MINSGKGAGTSVHSVLILHESCLWQGCSAAKCPGSKSSFSWGSLQKAACPLMVTCMGNVLNREYMAPCRPFAALVSSQSCRAGRASTGR